MVGAWVSNALPCLDCEVRNLVDWGEPLTHRLEVRTHDAYDRGVRAGSDPPYVEVDDPCVARPFDLLANLVLKVWIGGVEEHGGRVPHQRPRPGGDDDRADDAHHWVEPDPAEVATAEECHDGEHRGERIREHVDVGRAQIVVVMLMAGVAVVVRVIVATVVMAATKESGAGDIYK